MKYTPSFCRWSYFRSPLTSFVLAAAFTLGLAMARASDISYSLVDLGHLENQSPNWAMGINNLGQIVGISVTSANPRVTYLYSGGTNTVQNTPSLQFSYGMGINDSGLVVGYSSTSVSTPSQAYIYSGSRIPLGTLGGSESRGYAINASGAVTGESSFSSTLAAQHAFRYSNGVMTDLGTLATVANRTSQGYDINASGDVVGYSQINNTGTHAFLYSGTTMSDLGTLGGAVSVATGINDSGLITGYSTTANEAQMRAFVYSNGTMQAIGTLGGNYTVAVAINNAGQIVGYGSGTTSAPNHAFLYTGGTMYDLNVLVNDSGFKITTGPNSISNAINDWGQIVGQSDQGSTSGIHAVLLNPNTPVTTTTAGVTDAKIVGGVAYTQIAAVTNQAENSKGTTASFLGGTAGSGGSGTWGTNRDVTIAFSDRGAARLASDIVELHGTAGVGFADTFVLELTYDEADAIAFFGAEGDARLGWLNPETGLWELAVDGNSSGNYLFVGDRAYNADTDFVLGTYGLDTANNTVWAVLDHNSEFSTVPEPSAWAMVAIGLGSIIWLRQVRSPRNYQAV